MQSEIIGQQYFIFRSCIDPDLCEEYINKGPNEELELLHRSIAQNFCQGHTFNGCGAKLASTMNAKVGMFILSDPRQHSKCVFFNFHNFDFTALLSDNVLRY